MIFVILSKLTETIVHLCCDIILYLITIFLTQTKQLLFKFPFNFNSPVHPLIYSLFLSFCHIFASSNSSERTKWVNAIKLRTPKHSWFSVCLLQRHCSSGVLPVCADNCNIFCRLVYFISFPSPPPPSRTPHTQRACAPGHSGLRTVRAAQFQSSLRERGMWFSLGKSYHHT